MKETRGEKIFNVFNIIILILFMGLIIIPLLNVISISLTSNIEISARKFTLFPTNPDFGAYRVVLANGSSILRGFQISFYRVVIGTAANLIFTYFLAYGLSLKKLPGRTGITLFVFLTMIFHGGLIPTYILLTTLGFQNNFLVYILPMLISAWNTLLMRNFIMSIPESIYEAAELDGAREIIVIFRIILPLSLPAMATITLFYAVAHWNSWWDAYLYVSNPDLQPIQLVLRNILSVSQVSISKVSSALVALMGSMPPSRAIQNAVVVVSTIPIIIVYPFLQKYFVKGVMVGSIKG